MIGKYRFFIEDIIYLTTLRDFGGLRLKRCGWLVRILDSKSRGSWFETWEEKELSIKRKRNFCSPYSGFHTKGTSANGRKRSAFMGFELAAPRLRVESAHHLATRGDNKRKQRSSNKASARDGPIRARQCRSSIFFFSPEKGLFIHFWGKRGWASYSGGSIW